MYKYWVMEMMEAHHQQSLTMQMKQRRLGFGNGCITSPKVQPQEKDATTRLTPNGVRLGRFSANAVSQNGIHTSKSSGDQFKSAAAQSQVTKVRSVRPHNRESEVTSYTRLYSYTFYLGTVSV